MRTKIPQLKVTATRQDDRDKKKGFSGALSGLRQAITQAGGLRASPEDGWIENRVWRAPT